MLEIIHFFLSVSEVTCFRVLLAQMRKPICEDAKYVSFEILHKMDHGFIPYNEYFGFPRFEKAKKIASSYQRN